MGKQGCREIVMRAEDALITARWLRRVAIPALRNRPRTILAGDQTAADVAVLERLADEFTRKAVRKRSKSEFSALISVADAAAFARAVDGCRPSSPFAPWWPLRLDLALIRLAEVMRDGAQVKRRGRKWLSDDALNARVTGKLGLDERHRMRLAARSRKSAAWTEASDCWIAAISARGQTILTTDLPFPKF